MQINASGVEVTCTVLARTKMASGDVVLVFISHEDETWRAQPCHIEAFHRGDLFFWVPKDDREAMMKPFVHKRLPPRISEDEFWNIAARLDAAAG
jgi:hypothetical protein